MTSFFLMYTSWPVVAIQCLSLGATCILLGAMLIGEGIVSKRTNLIRIVILDVIVQIIELVWYVHEPHLVLDLAFDLSYYSMMLIFVVNESIFLQKITTLSNIRPQTVAKIKYGFYVVFFLTMAPVMIDDAWSVVKGYHDNLLYTIRVYCAIVWDFVCITYEVWQAVFIYIMLRNYTRVKYGNQNEDLTQERDDSLKALGRLQKLSFAIVGVDMTCVVLMAAATAIQEQNKLLSSDLSKATSTIAHAHMFFIVMLFRTIKQVTFPTSNSQKGTKEKYPKLVSPTKKTEVPVNTVLLSKDGIQTQRHS
ncbi:hypothetical protein EDD86DRAFT_217438 [Gorgonomyces haynaldii]|nr:hypothetical protein EDD86DRAFT_217438 [Gorgonomyces haynaldii]